MTQNTNNKPVYNLEERTFNFARDVRLFVKSLHLSSVNLEDAKQLVKSSGSVGANYREANESLSKKDFIMRLKVARKEAKESAYWLKLINETNNLPKPEDGLRLYKESLELRNILSAIINKTIS